MVSNLLHNWTVHQMVLMLSRPLLSFSLAKEFLHFLQVVSHNALSGKHFDLSIRFKSNTLRDGTRVVTANLAFFVLPFLPTLE